MITSQLTLALQKKYNLEPQRIYRSVDIINAGEIKLLPNGNYQVSSQSRPGTFHQVNPRYETCTCEDSERGNVCMHYISYLELRELAKTIPAPKPTYTYAQLFQKLGVSQ